MHSIHRVNHSFHIFDDSAESVNFQSVNHTSMYVFKYTPKYLLTVSLKVTNDFCCDGYGRISKINSFEKLASSIKNI